ncbi:MAG: biotin--[acetyl-CoA-carboxylase] ligase [Pseudomonadota bacterium]
MIGEFLSGPASDFRHVHFDEIGSTNSFLIEQVNAGEPGNLWVTAAIQTIGKGSRGRDWQSPVGNLYASLLLVEPGEVAKLHELTFVSALAVREAIATFSAEANCVQVKWPNDVLINQKKCSGILLESGTTNGLPFMVIGCGINCKTFPDTALHKASCLEAEGIIVQPTELFQSFSNAMASMLETWAQGAGFQKIRQSWLDHAIGIGEQVRIEIPGKDTLQGRFVSVDERGYMVIENQDLVLTRISTADVFFNQQAPSRRSS